MKKLAEDFEHKTKNIDLSYDEPYKQYIPKPIKQTDKSGIRIDKNGIKRYYNSLGQLHRLDGPAVINPDGNQLWYHNGKLHRENGPAANFFNGTQKWYMDGDEMSSVEVLQLLLNKGMISKHDIETLKELADIAFFDYAKTDVRAVKQAGALLMERKVISSRNMHVIVNFLKAATKL
jgi:hypothetical protein